MEAGGALGIAGGGRTVGGRPLGLNGGMPRYDEPVGIGGSVAEVIRVVEKGGKEELGETL